MALRAATEVEASQTNGQTGFALIWNLSNWMIVSKNAIIRRGKDRRKSWRTRGRQSYNRTGHLDWEILSPYKIEFCRNNWTLELRGCEEASIATKSKVRHWVNFEKEEKRACAIRYSRTHEGSDDNTLEVGCANPMTKPLTIWRSHCNFCAEDYYDYLSTSKNLERTHPCWRHLQSWVEENIVLRILDGNSMKHFPITSHLTIAYSVTESTPLFITP